MFFWRLFLMFVWMFFWMCVCVCVWMFLGWGSSWRLWELAEYCPGSF